MTRTLFIYHSCISEICVVLPSNKAHYFQGAVANVCTVCKDIVSDASTSGTTIADCEYTFIHHLYPVPKDEIPLQNDKHMSELCDNSTRRVLDYLMHSNLTFVQLERTFLDWLLTVTKVQAYTTNSTPSRRAASH